jgi:hypothetical protein
MNIFWIFYEYYEWFDGKGNAVTQHLQLLLVICCVLVARLRRKSRERFCGRKVKRLAVCSPSAEVAMDEDPLDQLQLELWILAILDQFVSFYRQIRSKRPVWWILCYGYSVKWVLSPQNVNWPSISTDAVKISALRDAAGCVFQTYHSISFLSWWMNFSPSQIVAFPRFLPCLHFAQPFVQATRVLYRQGKFVVGTSDWDIWDNKPDSLSLPAPLPANRWTVTKGYLSQLSFKFFEMKWSQVSQVVQTLDFEIFFVEVPPTCCSWLRTWHHAEEPDVRNAHVAAMFAKGTEGNGNCACFSHPRLGDSLVEEPYSMILGRLNSLGLIVVGLNWAEAPTLPFDHCRKTVSKFQKTFPGPAFSCCKHISK